MKKITMLFGILIIGILITGMSCTQDHHDINTYSGYGAGNNNNNSDSNNPDRNNPNRGNITNLPAEGAV